MNGRRVIQHDNANSKLMFAHFFFHVYTIQSKDASGSELKVWRYLCNTYRQNASFMIYY